VLRAHREGILTACSIVANGDHFEDAARALRESPDLDVGVHLAFVGERPLSPPGEVRSLLGRDEGLLRDHRAFLQRHYAGGVVLGELEREARRQVERVREAGLAVRHLNAHQHLHVVPAVFEIVLRLAQEHRVPYVRVPRDAAPRGLRFGRWLAVRALARFADRAAARLHDTAIRANDRTIGILDAGRITTARLLALLDQVQGVTELVSHPGAGDAAIARRYAWRYRWDAEREALCDGAVRKKIAAEGITLGGVRRLLEIAS
jgi:predicted glycoside hydrolase/deacetylase ChbG (UPF0249 family)